MTKFKNPNCAKLKILNCDNSKTLIVMVIKMIVVREVVIMTAFSKKKHLNTLTTDPLSGQLFETLAMFFLSILKKIMWETPTLHIEAPIAINMPAAYKKGGGGLKHLHNFRLHLRTIHESTPAMCGQSTSPIWNNSSFLRLHVWTIHKSNTSNVWKIPEYNAEQLLVPRIHELNGRVR